MNTNLIYGHEQQISYLNLIITNKKIPQTILFSGTTGIGKKLIAKQFIYSQFCKELNSPCGKCHICQQLKAGSFPDFIMLEPNENNKIAIGKANENTPGTVRWLIHRLSQQPISDVYGVIIDGIEKISVEGQNALLKTIEEPGLNTRIVLITSAKSQILPTIISRCSQLSFNPLSTNEVLNIISPDQTPDSKISFIALISGGSAEYANALLEKELFEGILTFCAELSAYFLTNKPFQFEVDNLQKKAEKINIIDISLNIYSEMLRICLNKKNDYNAYFDNLYIDEPNTICKVIKILLAIKKTERKNINIYNALKGMCYYNTKSKLETPPLMERINTI